ncbi:MAG: transglutaminase domain-containing protein, partial [Oscillospiraceae bacterium]|nr:transglutaminase domain-containing protein [Oscillospiraceae bacterium]
MCFMLPERTGIVVLTAVMFLFGGAEFLLKQLSYERPELFKNIRSDFQDYVASLHLTDSPLLENYGTDQTISPDDLEHIPLGSLEEKIYKNISVTSVAFSENPNTRIYLKYRTGFAYDSSSWTVFPEGIYQNPDIKNFEYLNYYPPEFLYSTVTGTPVDMTFYYPNNILSQCIPYGFQKNENVLCQINDTVQTNTDHYLIQGNTDYEEIFSNPDAVSQMAVSDLLLNCPSEDTEILSSLLSSGNSGNVWISSNHAMTSTFQNENASTAKAFEAGILCGTFYDDFVYENYTVLPDTSSMQEIRTAYNSELQNFNARTASPAETILKLQELRDKVCDNVTYTLSPGKTPPDTDHTAYFLLENKKGYCEHYATAGTVLARMAGIPARYCEGYMLDCSRNGTLTETQSEDGSISYVSEILDSNAHAWTEIYLSGIGWIPFEFTFSYFNSSALLEHTVPETLPKETLPAPTVPPSPVPVPSETIPVPEHSEISPQMFLIMLFLT